MQKYAFSLYYYHLYTGYSHRNTVYLSDMQYPSINTFQRWLILIAICILGMSSSYAEDDEVVVLAAQRSKVLTDLMTGVRKYSPHYAHQVKEYKGQMYVKGTVNVDKMNQLLRFVPFMFRLKKDTRHYVMESMSSLHYTYPDVYDQKVCYAQGTITRGNDYHATILRHLQVNIYKEDMDKQYVYSPLGPDGDKYYKYKIDSIFEYNGDVTYKVYFTPKTNSYQLLKGWFWVSGSNYTVRKMYYEGRDEFFSYKTHFNMGTLHSRSELLPVDVQVSLDFKFLWNKVHGDYTAVLGYQTVTQVPYSDCAIRVKKERQRLDFTQSYSLQQDTIPVEKDSCLFASMRPVPLTDVEKETYKQFGLQQDSIARYKAGNKTWKPINVWGDLGDRLIHSYKFDLKGAGDLKCSPLLNPFYLDYSRNNGITYKQKFRYNRIMKGDRLLRVTPRMGYNFTRNEFYWDLKSEFYYWPTQNASIHIRAGWGNRINSSELIDKIKSDPEPKFNLDSINLQKFKDQFINIFHRVEPVNGLEINTGISIHQRNETSKTKLIIEDPISTVDPDLLSKLRHVYTSFSPRVIVRYTPYQRYYYDGKRKVNLDSDYPTFTLDWERAIPGVGCATMSYERIELDMHHHLHIGALQHLYYRIGAGAFVDKDDLFFADFVNFSKSNLPDDWNDEIGGTFQILDRKYYNAADKYIRAHATYESPFLLMNRLFPKKGLVLNERLYFSLLSMPNFTPYSEIGYGVATNVCDFGVFAGGLKGNMTHLGVKLSFKFFK